MFKNSELSNEIASSLHNKLTIVKNADAHVKKSIFSEALNHLSEAADLLDRAGDDVTASAITAILEKFADEFSPFAEHDMSPDTMMAGAVDEIQNQINALPEKDEQHVRGVLEDNGYEVTSDPGAKEIKAHKPSMGDEPEVNVRVKPDTEPGMGGHWTVEIDAEAETTVLEGDMEPEELEELKQVASRLIQLSKVGR